MASTKGNVGSLGFFGGVALFDMVIRRTVQITMLPDMADVCIQSEQRQRDKS
jgi:hypothetical protein